MIVRMDGVEVGSFYDFDVHACISSGFNGGVEEASGFSFPPLFGDGSDGVPPFLGRNRVWVGLSRPSSEPHDVPPLVRGLW